MSPGPTARRRLQWSLSPANRHLIIASLAPSRQFLRRALLWSSPDGREGAHLIEFSGHWRSHECTVERWYQLQLERSRLQESTTRFSVIWHYRTLNAPFYHEFLLIPLADGSCYRVERTGVGSNLDAIDQSGCTACDLIEWFPPGKHGMLVNDKNSILVTEVRLPSDLDVLDVLAICYSIQKHPAARRYTLQRYNCYFFCCTVLSVLARRQTDLKLVNSSEQWNMSITTMLGSVFSLSAPALKKSYFALRVCSALDPADPLSAKFVLKELERVFITDFNGLRTCQNLFRSSLWLSHFSSLFYTYLRSLSRAAGRTAYEKQCLSLPAMALMSAYNDELDPESKSTYEQVAYVCMQEDVYVSSKPSNTFRKQVLPSFSSFRLGARVTAFLVRPAVSSSYLSNVATRYRSRQGPERLHIAATAETQVTESHLEPAYYFNQDNLDAFEDESISHRTASAALDRLESIGMSSPSHVVSLCRILEHSKHRSCWEYSVEALVSDTLELAIKADVSRTTILLVYSTKSGLASRRANIFEFQDYVRDHIKTYADRVEKHQLGSSELVCRDIEDTMLEVWQSMPVGFGASQPLESHPGGQYSRWRL